MPKILIKAMPKGRRLAAVHHIGPDGKPVYMSTWTAKQKWIKERAKQRAEAKVKSGRGEKVLTRSGTLGYKSQVEARKRYKEKKGKEVAKEIKRIKTQQPKEAPPVGVYFAKVKKPKTPIQKEIYTYVKNYIGPKVSVGHVRSVVARSKAGRGKHIDEIKFLDDLTSQGYEIVTGTFGFHWIKKGMGGDMPNILLINKGIGSRIRQGLQLVASKLNPTIRRWKKIMTETPINKKEAEGDWRQGFFDSKVKVKPMENPTRSYLLGYYAGKIKRNPKLMKKQKARLARLMQEARARGITIAKSFDDNFDLVKGKPIKNQPGMRYDEGKHRWVRDVKKPIEKPIKKEPEKKIEPEKKVSQYASKFNKAFQGFKDTKFATFVDKDAEKEGDSLISLKQAKVTGYNIAMYDVAGDDYVSALLAINKHNMFYHNYTVHGDHGNQLLMEMEKAGLKVDYDVMLKASAVQYFDSWGPEPNAEFSKESVVKLNPDTGKKERCRIAKTAEYGIVFKAKDKAEIEKIATFFEKRTIRKTTEFKNSIKDSWWVPDVRYSNKEHANELEKKKVNIRKMRKQNVMTLTTKPLGKALGYYARDVFLNKGLAGFIKSMNFHILDLIKSVVDMLK